MSIVDLHRRVSRLAVPQTRSDDDIVARLTPDQMMRAAELRARWEAVGFDGFTDQEHADANAIRAALLGEGNEGTV